MKMDVAVSTMESEYDAMAQVMRDLIPLWELVKEVSVALKWEETLKCRTYSSTYATVPQMTPQSKHIMVKYHFFGENVKKGEIKIINVNTAEQIADIMMKGLPAKRFKKLGMLLVGW